MWEEFSRDYNCKIRIDWRDGRPLALAKREKTRTQLQREKTWFSSHEKTANSKAVECRQRKPRKGIDPPTYSRSFFKKYTVIFARIKKSYLHEKFLLVSFLVIMWSHQGSDPALMFGLDPQNCRSLCGVAPLVKSSCIEVCVELI